MIQTTKTPVDEPLDFELVNEAKLVPLINAIRFKLSTRAHYRRGLTDRQLPAREVMRAILLNAPDAEEMRRYYLDRGADTPPELAFSQMPRNYEFRLFAIENLVDPERYSMFATNVKSALAIRRPIRHRATLAKVPRLRLPNIPPADARFYALFWMLDNPGNEDAFSLGPTVIPHPVFPSYSTVFSI